MSTLVEAFARFTLGLPPLLVIAVAALLAAGALRWLVRYGFDVHKRGRHRGLVVAPALAGGLGLIMVTVDAVSPLAADINVPLPASLVFYPVIGFVAETVFHLLPLAVLVPVLKLLARGTGDDVAIWAAIVVASLVEPTFQAVLAAPEGYPLWQDVYVAVHIFVLNILQLWLYRRYDFVSMYLLRLVYYLIWHIAWGHLRLGLLF